MENRVERPRLIEALARFSDLRLLVVGDIMLDQFVWGEVSRISPEAPVPVVDVQRETLLLGGAANVAHNIRALGSGVVLGGAVGADAMGEALLGLAEALVVGTDAVIRTTQPTTLKTRIMARGQQVVRVDRESRARIEADALEAMSKALGQVAEGVDAIVVSDYAKGAITAEVMTRLRQIAQHRNVPLLVDPKPANAQFYHDVTVLTPNQREAEIMTGVTITGEESLREAIDVLHRRLAPEAVVVTRGAHGMGLWRQDSGLFTVPTMAREVFDVTGAGDTVIAVLALGMAAGLQIEAAAFLANLAAGVVVGKVGTATVTPQEIVDMLVA